MNFYLGPEDARPRALFWACLLFAGLDVVLALLGVAAAMTADIHRPLAHRAAFGSLVSLAASAAGVLAIYHGWYACQGFFAAFKGFGCLMLAASAAGTQAAGDGDAWSRAAPLIGVQLLLAAAVAANACVRTAQERARRRAVEDVADAARGYR